MTKILFLDTETTGFLEDPKARVIELGYAVWDDKLGIQHLQNNLVLPHGQPIEVTPEITAINGITTEMLVDWAMQPEPIYDRLNAMIGRCHLVMCANVEFDRSFLVREFTAMSRQLAPMPWGDFLTDIPYGPKVKGASVAHIAADHGIVNPFPHRALTDVLTMISVIEKGGYNMTEVAELCAQPKVRLAVADKSYNEARNALAKAAGFRFSKHLGNRWVRTVPISKVQDVVSQCKFEVTNLGAV